MSDEKKGHMFTQKMNPGSAEIEAFRRQELLNGARNALRTAARRRCKYCESSVTNEVPAATRTAGLWLHGYVRLCKAPVCCDLLLLGDDELLKEIGYKEKP